MDREGYIQKEIKFALSKALEMPEGRIFLIPVRFEECEVPFSLSRYQWVDLFDEVGYARMIRALRFRASQLQRTTVELPKTTVVDEPKNVVLIDEQESIEKAVRESAERETPENAKSEKAERRSAQIAASKEILSKKRLFLRIGVLIGIIFALLWVGSLAGFQFPSLVSTATATPLPIETIDPKGVTMRLVPAGEFTMGSNTSGDEQPIHKVDVDAFYMDKYEVTNALYKVCVDVAICQPPKHTNSFTRPSYYGKSDFDNYPVIYVNWNMANTYCKWRDARLPTEAEWEKAARGTDEQPYPWGEEIDCNKANYSNCKRDTTEVDSYESGVSPYGLYNMAGNVWEWVDTWYNAYTDNSISHGVETKYRVLRGGSWGSDDKNVRSANRLNSRPTNSDYRDGFRCAKDAP